MTLLALNPMAGKGKSKQPELEKKVEIELDQDVFRAFELLQEILPRFELINLGRFKTELENEQLPVLDPIQLDLLLQRILMEDGLLEEDDRPLTYFTTLIQLSYENKHNDFFLDIDRPIDGVLSNLLGTKEVPLRVAVNGSLGHYCALNLNNCEIRVKGNVGLDFGSAMKESTIIVHGDVEHNCAYNSSNCFIQIEGNAGSCFGSELQDTLVQINGDCEDKCGRLARTSSFIIRGDAEYEIGDHARYCVFLLKKDVGKKCGVKSRQSYFIINGNAGHCLGEDSQHSIFEVYGNTGERCGYDALDCDFELHGNVGKNLGIRAVDCKFKIFDANTYNRLMKTLPDIGDVEVLHMSSKRDPNKFWSKIESGKE